MSKKITDHDIKDIKSKFDFIDQQIKDLQNLKKSILAKVWISKQWFFYRIKKTQPIDTHPKCWS